MIALLALGLLILIVLILASKWYVKATPQDIIWTLKWVALVLVMIFVAWLALSGRLFAAAAALPVVMVWLTRLFTGYRYAKMFKNMMGGQQQRTPQTSSTMTRAEALKILGLQDGAGEEEIKASHRRLIAHLHPDVGGSDYLAQQINLAKDVLLG